MANDIDLKMRILAEDLASQKFKQVSKSIEGTEKQGRGLGKTLAGLGAAAAVGAFAKSAVSSYKAAAKETLALQRATGGAAEDVSRLRFAAKQSGLEVGAFTGAVNKADKTLVAASKSPKKLADLTSRLGVTLVDTAGKIRPMTELLPELAEKFAAMESGPEKTALAMELFGRSGAQMLPFLNKGKDGLAALAAESDRLGLTLSGKQLDAVKANIAASRDFTAATDALKQSVGQELLPAVTSGTQGLTSLLGVTEKIPGPVKSVALAVTVLGAGFLLLAPRIAATKAAFVDLNITTAATKGRLSAAGGVLGGPWGVALLAGTVLLGAHAKSQADAASSADEFSASLDRQTGALTVETYTQLAKDLTTVADQSIWEKLNGRQGGGAEASKWEALGISVQEAMHAVTTGGAEYEALLARVKAAEAETAGWFSPADNGMSKALVDQRQKVEEGTAAWAQNKDANQFAAEATGANADAVDDLGASTAQTTKEVVTFSQTLADAIDPTVNMDRATIAYDNSLAALAKGLKENGKSFDENTQKGRDNRGLVLDSIDSAKSYADTVYATAIKRKQSEASAATAAEKAYNKKVKGVREALTIMGVEKETIDRLVTKYDGKTIGLHVYSDLFNESKSVETARERSGRGRTRNASGGLILGPGTGTSDDIPAMLSNGEYVIRAAAVDHYGVGAFDSMNALRLAGGGSVGDIVRDATTGGSGGSGGGSGGSGGSGGGSKAKKKAKKKPTASKHQLSVLDAAKDTLDDARSTLSQLRDDRDSLVASVAGSVKSFASIAGFDVTKHADDVKRVTDATLGLKSAEDDLFQARAKAKSGDVDAANRVTAANQGIKDAESELFEARRQANQVSGPGTGAARAAALKSVAEAEKKVTAAKGEKITAVKAERTAHIDGNKAVAESEQKVRDAKQTKSDAVGAEKSSRVNAKNILGNMRTKLAAAWKFKSVLSRLVKAKLNNTTLQEVIAEGPVNGSLLGEALLASAGAVKTANSLQGSINKTSKGIGKIAGKSEFSGDIKDAVKDRNAAGQKYNRAKVNVVKAEGHGAKYEFVMYLDGKAVHTSLLKVKRHKGRGAKLGLD